ncbi:alpha-glucosyltransferase N-terminal domain-containing protein [Bacillus altitudinis]|uniref:alpha-glucosyltransferase N-terminal domain-containing protein n=1 Tax=Bacillus altitudinis TaxID=293387 RepID=UPI0005431430|nr:alpha-glucosyltransferase N-terminal domain-containing protein [Bacillus altitudinis]KWZ66571.1 poly(glycerol-phosphate) alpha-glucosyltransferase [Bacillus altitudinis]MCM3043650.1 poly(glycerol-phosphate) alpha-glucosyltransferase [Bacillus altitudinis]MEC1803147.1 alpha-glucosyltransferase N-terminal domain-containing protein [Bacillus altitudinis]MEC3811629.1 alpha-glucosyltransferase N-terminal domain-containing protein [Bacillus altitudinis]
MFQNWMKKKVEDTLDQPEQNETMTLVEIPDMDYYFIVGDVPNEEDGLTKSLKARIEPLAEKHKRTTMLTLNFDVNVKERIRRLEETFHPQIDILNVFEHYIMPESGSKRYYSEFIAGEVPQSINEAVIPADTSTIQVTRYELPSSPICMIDQYNEEQQLVKREEYNWQGALRRVQSFVPNTGALYLEELIKDDGSIFMEIIYAGDAKKNPVRHINWYKKTGIQTFTKKTDIKQQWLSSIQLQNDRLKLMITEDRDQDRHLFKIDQPESTYYAAFVHEAHYEENPHHIYSQYGELFKQIRKQQVDAVFFGDTKHKEDVEKVLGEQTYFYHVPSEMSAWKTVLHQMLENRIRKDKLRKIVDRTKWVLHGLSSEHHVLHLQLKMTDEMSQADHVEIDFAGYDRVNGAEIISQTIDENDQVSFPIGHFQTKKNIETNQTKFVDFYIRFKTEELQEVLQRLEVEGELLTNKPSSIDGWSYQTKQGNYSWKVK